MGCGNCTSASGQGDKNLYTLQGNDKALVRQLQKEKLALTKKFDDSQLNKLNASNPKIVRQDLSVELTNVHEAKNNICLCLIVENLQLEHFPPLELHEKKQPNEDEFSYACTMATQMLSKKTPGQQYQSCKEIIEFFCIEGTNNTQIDSFLESAEATDAEWYYQYGKVLIQQIQYLYDISESYWLSCQVQPDQTWLRDLVSSFLVLTRYLEGLSWGYSQQLEHKELDVDNLICLRLTYNLIQSLISRTPGHSPPSKPHYFFCQEQFLICHSLKGLETMISYTPADKSEPPYTLDVLNLQRQYIENPNGELFQDYKSQLISFLSRKSLLEQPLTFKNYKAILDAQTPICNNYLESLRQQGDGKFIPKLQSLKSGSVKNMPILMLIGNATITRIILEQFLLQKHDSEELLSQSQLEYEIIVYHCCLSTNRITCDTYLILKHIMVKVAQIPFVKQALALHIQNQSFDDPSIGEMIDPTGVSADRLQEGGPHTFKRFLQIVQTISCSTKNYAVVLTGLENLYQETDLENFVLIMRSVASCLPSWLKFIFTVERRGSNYNRVLKCGQVLSPISQTIRVIDDDQTKQDLSELEEKEESIQKMTAAVEGLSLIELFIIHQFVTVYAPIDITSFNNACEKNDELGIDVFKLLNERVGSFVFWKSNGEDGVFVVPTRKKMLKVIVRAMIVKKMDEGFLEVFSQVTPPMCTWPIYSSQVPKALQTIFWVHILHIPFYHFHMWPAYLRGFFYHYEVPNFGSSEKMAKISNQMPTRLQVEEKLIKNIKKTLKSSERVSQYLDQKSKGSQKIESQRSVNQANRPIMTPQILYEQLMVQGSYSRLIKQLKLFLHINYKNPSVASELPNVIESLTFVHQALKHDQPSYADFLTQYEARTQPRLSSKGAHESVSSRAPKSQSHARARATESDTFASQTTLTKNASHMLTRSAFQQNDASEQKSSVQPPSRHPDNTGNEELIYFQTEHLTLMENPRIDFILQFAPSPIVACKYLKTSPQGSGLGISNQQQAACQAQVVFVQANGLTYLAQYDFIDGLQWRLLAADQCQQINTDTYTSYQPVVLDKLKVVDDKYLIQAGWDPYIRVFNLDNERMIAKFQPHPDQPDTEYICHLQVRQEYLVSYSNKQITKWNWHTEELLAEMNTKVQVVQMKLRKNGLITCQDIDNLSIVFYDLDLKLLSAINLDYPPTQVKKFLSLSQTQCLVYMNDGEMIVYNTGEDQITKERAGSIFSLKNEDYQDIMLIKSKENFFFAIESQKMEFFSVASFKKSDSWDYFFQSRLVGSSKNKEGSKICVWDDHSCCTLFNFLKKVPESVKSRQPPSHRRLDLIQCVDSSKQYVISCSLDRELRVWDALNSKFVKKYDLASFTQEAVTSLRLSGCGEMLFLGSKDSNVYLIDILKGKLCIVYEGHWTRISMIYIVPGKDILITISESNIKVWDLEYDECIKNMNDHNSTIVHCSLEAANEDNVITISQNLEFFRWNYTTGVIEENFQIKLPSKEHHQLVACDISQDGKQAYLALENHQIIVYQLSLRHSLAAITSYKREDVVYIKAVSSSSADYLVCATRTTCILYLLCDYGIMKLCAYHLNANKRPPTLHRDKYSYQTRFYFTTCKVQWKTEQEVPDDYSEDFEPLSNNAKSRHKPDFSLTSMQPLNETTQLLDNLPLQNGQSTNQQTMMKSDIQFSKSPFRANTNNMLITQTNPITEPPQQLLINQLPQVQPPYHNNGSGEKSMLVTQEIKVDGGGVGRDRDKRVGEQPVSAKQRLQVILGDSRGIMHLTELNLS